MQNASDFGRHRTAQCGAGQRSVGLAQPAQHRAAAQRWELAALKAAPCCRRRARRGACRPIAQLGAGGAAAGGSGPHHSTVPVARCPRPTGGPTSAPWRRRRRAVDCGTCSPLFSPPLRPALSPSRACARARSPPAAASLSQPHPLTSKGATIVILSHVDHAQHQYDPQ